MIVALVRDEDGTCTMFEFLALPRRTLLHGTCLLIYIYIYYIIYIYVYIVIYNMNILLNVDTHVHF